jgi:hypothetical protein
MDRWEAVTALTVAKDAQGESENDSRKPRDLLKNRHSDRLKRVNLLFPMGCWRREMALMMLIMMMR